MPELPESLVSTASITLWHNETIFLDDGRMRFRALIG